MNKRSPQSMKMTIFREEGRPFDTYSPIADTEDGNFLTIPKSFCLLIVAHYTQTLLLVLDSKNIEKMVYYKSNFTHRSRMF